MALSKDKKAEIIDEAKNLFDTSKLTVVARYSGTSVKAMQSLRRQSRDSGTVVKVLKNRLVKKALADSEALKSLDTDFLSGQLLYAFNADDEVAPAQNLADFAKTETQLEFVGAITADGTFLAAEDVKALAALPSKEQLRGMLVGTIAAPLSGFVNVMAGNLRGVINALNARSEQLG